MPYQLSCPVPKKQRPINEYMELVQSDFFNWPVQKQWIFSQKIAKNFFLFFLFFLPISNFVYDINQSITELFLFNACCSTSWIYLILIRLFLGWTYVKKRLYNPAIFYEESGWYDGRVWIKSKNILVQDRFIYTYQVLPTIKKLNQVFILITCLLMLFVVLLLFS